MEQGTEYWQGLKLGQHAARWMQPNQGMRKPPGRQHQHQHIGLHFACTPASHTSTRDHSVQKCGETEMKRVSPSAVQKTGESLCGPDKSLSNTREPDCTGRGSGQGQETGTIGLCAVAGAHIWQDRCPRAPPQQQETRHGRTQTGGTEQGGPKVSWGSWV